MLEHTTDRLFWTLSTIIIDTLLLTVGVKVYTHAVNAIIEIKNI